MVKWEVRIKKFQNARFPKRLSSLNHLSRYLLIKRGHKSITRKTWDPGNGLQLRRKGYSSRGGKGKPQEIGRPRNEAAHTGAGGQSSSRFPRKNNNIETCLTSGVAILEAFYRPLKDVGQFSQTDNKRKLTQQNRQLLIPREKQKLYKKGRHNRPFS